MESRYVPDFKVTIKPWLTFSQSFGYKCFNQTELKTARHWNVSDLFS